MHASEVTIAYGQTEASPVITQTRTNDPLELRVSSVGRAISNVEVKIVDPETGKPLPPGVQGELCARGSLVMKGYYKDPEETARVLQDGWLKTGDIAEIDEDGYVYIVDRKKEIIITSGGKNIAPQPIENVLRMDKYISLACVYGDRKPYLVAILTPNLERLIQMAQDEGLDYLDMEDLVTNQQVQKRYAHRLQLINDKLPSYQTIKKFILLPREFSVEGDELTPTLKLKRKKIYAKYQDRIERLYLHNVNGSDDHSKDNGGDS